MLYDYLCLDCLDKVESEDSLSDAIFETKHSINPTPEELAHTTICPRCQGTRTERQFGNPIISIRGQGWTDKAGIKRDMDHFKLTIKDSDGESNDPYYQHRLPGEADELAHRIKKAGTREGKTKKIHFDTGSKPRQ